MSDASPSTAPTVVPATAARPSRRGWLTAPLRFLARMRAAIGIVGILWSAMAVVFGLVSCVIILGYNRINEDLRAIRAELAVGNDFRMAGEDLDRIVLVLVSQRVQDGGAGRPRSALTAWAHADAAFRRLCADTGRDADALARRITGTCDMVGVLERSLRPALQAYVERGVMLPESLFSALLEAATATRATADAFDAAYGDAHAALIEAQNRATPALLVCAASFVISLLILILLLVRSASRHHVASQTAIAAHAEAQRSRQQLLDAIEALPVGFALYSRDERLVLFNKTMATMTHGTLDQSAIGQSFEVLIDKAMAVLQRDKPEFDVAALRQDLMARFRTPDVAFNRTLHDGRIYRFSGGHTHEGGTVLIRTEITELKRREEELHRSERRYASLVNSLADTVFSLDREGRFTYVSGRVAELLGYAPEELLGRSVLDVFHPADQPLLGGVLMQLRANRGVVAPFTCRLQRKDGGHRLTEIRVAAPDKHDNGSGQWAMIGIGRDVEAQEEMARRLRDRMERLNSIVQSTGALFVLLDRELKVVMANNEFQAFFTLKEEQAIGRPLHDLVECALDPALIENWLAAAPDAALTPAMFDNVLSNARGERRTIRCTVNPVRGESGRVEHFVMLGVDETDRRRTELELFNASRLATLGEMASGIAHEINQPLAVICLAAEYLLDELHDAAGESPLEASKPFIDEQCQRIMAQAERAATIIRDLRGFARKPDEAVERIDVRQAVRTAANLVSEQMRLAGVNVERDVDPGCPPIAGHASRLQQVLINLLINARDALLEQDPPTGTITIRARQSAQEGKVSVIVEDDGPGIPEHVLPRLFEPFFTTKPTGKGTGLGLSISYQIIRHMGGVIAADNRPEGGARFTITLDAAPEAPGEITRTAA